MYLHYIVKCVPRSFLTFYSLSDKNTTVVYDWYRLDSRGHYQMNGRRRLERTSNFPLMEKKLARRK